MEPLTRDAVRAAIVNLDPGAARVRLPVWFDEIDWPARNYLAWRDPRAPARAYLVAELDGVPTGVLLRQSPPQPALAWRSVMCDLCRTARRFNEVSLFAARRASRDKRQRLSTLGLYICAEFECAEGRDDRHQQARGEGIRERTRRFLGRVGSRPGGTTKEP